MYNTILQKVKILQRVKKINLEKIELGKVKSR